MSATTNMARTLVLSIVVMVLAIDTFAQSGKIEIQVLALAKEKVVVLIDGKRQVLKLGEKSPDGITLLETGIKTALVDINGAQAVLEAGQVVTPYVSTPLPETGTGSVTLWADADGFYRAPGQINGSTVRFLVDTGATAVTISAALAKRIGLDLSKGQQTFAQTASGITPMTLLTLKSVSVGRIKLHNVQAGVLPGQLPPTPLLGASFLNRVNMERDGQKMKLRKTH